MIITSRFDTIIDGKKFTKILCYIDPGKETPFKDQIIESNITLYIPDITLNAKELVICGHKGKIKIFDRKINYLYPEFEKQMIIVNVNITKDELGKLF